MLSQEDQTSLIWLQWHWEKHYVIRVMDGEWQAYAADAPLEVLSANSAMELRDRMKDDFAERATRQWRERMAALTPLAAEEQ